MAATSCLWLNIGKHTTTILPALFVLRVVRCKIMKAFSEILIECELGDKRGGSWGIDLISEPYFIILLSSTDARARISADVGAGEYIQPTLLLLTHNFKFKPTSKGRK